MNAETFEIICNVLAFFMLFMAIMISTTSTVNRMIPLYQIQSGLLALITGFTAVQFINQKLLYGMVVLVFSAVPLLLLLIIKPLLVLASVPEDVSPEKRIKRLFDKQVLGEARQRAYPAWLAQCTTRPIAFGTALLDLFLLTLAFLIAFSLVKKPLTANLLAISFSLLLLGLSVMRSKTDIISQIMGLLIMEHGMFLAAIRLIPMSLAIVAFVVSLILYVMVTLTILVILLPDIHRISGTIQVDQQERLQG